MTITGRLGRLATAALLGIMVEAVPVDAGQTKASEPASAWVLGQIEVKVHQVFEAWFDRDAAAISLADEVSLGSPSNVKLWFRAAGETCAEAEKTGRMKSTPQDGSLLHVCARATATGQAVLGARAPSGSWRISEPVAITPPYTTDPAVVSGLTTLVSFIVGLLTAFLTQIIQDRRASRRETEKIANAAIEALKGEVGAEVLKNSRAVDAFLLDKQSPPNLEVAAFNSVFAAQKAAFNAMTSAHFDSYRKQLEDLYKTTIAHYEDSVTAWQTASPTDKPAAWSSVLAAAAEIQKQIRHF